MDERKICKRCLLRDMVDADMAMIEKYKNAIKANERVGEAEYERRLSICKECDKLNAGTCNSCGCYVELRAVSIVGRCPNKRW
ncbi:MAG: hypothetical protein IKY04_07845 [Lachnospiraceae bacterium]|nr:hypothetical protein [Lachnospiraceae bacterium]